PQLSFLPIPRPPRPTLFPYTTLFRSRPHRRSALGVVEQQLAAGDTDPVVEGGDVYAVGRVDEHVQRRGADRLGIGAFRGCLPARSEEHTSELQSRENLVCRLLLEKKK